MENRGLTLEAYAIALGRMKTTATAIAMATALVSSVAVADRTVVRIPVDGTPVVTSTSNLGFRLVTESKRGKRDRRDASKRAKPVEISWFIENTSDEEIWVPMLGACMCVKPGYHRIFVRQGSRWFELAIDDPFGRSNTAWLFVGPEERWLVVGAPFDGDPLVWDEFLVEFVYRIDDQHHIQNVRWTGAQDKR